jgi:xanthine dehydrogenase YagT iron-sulfur-binding subunit
MSGNICRCGAYNGIVEAIAETFPPHPAVSVERVSA